MSNQTFDFDAQTVTPKEDIEWLRIWCEDTNATLPRVALIGDSITEGYFPLVKDALQKVARVDYLATSYAITSPAYWKCVKSFVADSDYTVIHFNYGLHAHHIDDDTYEEKCREMLAFLRKECQAVIIGNTTIVLNADLATENERWQGKVAARNDRLCRIAEDEGFRLDDLNTVARTLPSAAFKLDGVHFEHDGYAALAANVVSAIRSYL